MVSWQQKSKLTPREIQPKYLFSANKINRQRAWVEIDLDALAHNVRSIKALLNPQTAMMAVVKADAYGHGAVTTAQTVLQHGADWLAVATVTEGIELRQAGINCNILLLGAINSAEEIIEVAKWQLEPTICNTQQALIFSETLSKINISLPVHLKIDTGMTRLGTSWEQSVEFAQLVTGLPYLEIKSVYSHLATADDPDPTVMSAQQQRFRKAIADLQAQGIEPPLLHLANSAGTLCGTDFHYDMVRVGLALYGLYPAPHLQDKIKLQPALQLKARITQIKTILPGTGVSYGHKFISDREMTIAVVSIGYADGVVRGLSNNLQGMINGKLAPQIGAITMDQLMLDVSDIPHLQPGNIVTFLGKDENQAIEVDDWADKLNTISWEILCGFKHRLPRIIK